MPQTLEDCAQSASTKGGQTNPHGLDSTTQKGSSWKHN